MTWKKSILATTFCAFTMIAASATAASAGELNGNGEPVPAITKANSICVFSGLNDDPTSPTTPGEIGPNGPGGRTQSFGQDVRLGLANPRAFNPGDACRGGSNPSRLP